MLLALLACTTAPSGKSDDTGAPDDSAADSVADSDSDTDSGDSGSGYTDAELAPSDITIELTSVVTVARVRWTTAVPTRGLVRFGEDETYRLRTPETEASTEHEVLLLGMYADTLFHLAVTSVDGDHEVTSGDYTVTTGTLPEEVPEFTVSGVATSWAGEYQVLPVQGERNVVVVIDDHGRVVWYELLEEDLLLMRALFSVDGQSIVVLLTGPQGFLESSNVLRVSMDGETRTTYFWPYLDHDFAELPDGTFAGITVTSRDGWRSTGNDIVEMAPDGTMTTVWSAWDDPVLLAHASDDVASWSHGNALDYLPEDDAYCVSSKELGTLTKIDRASGASIWHLNGQANEFTFTEPERMVLMQHQFEMLPGGVLIFDNGETSRGWSQAIEYTLDEDARTADPTWSYKHEPPLGVYAKGDVERYADGNTKVVWSAYGIMQDVTPEGDTVWQIDTDAGESITFVHHVASLYGTD